jgi:uncharacterized RDD family membrane protein YckC
VLFAFGLLFIVAAGLNIWVRSDFGREDPSDAAFWNSAMIFIAAVPAWMLLNLYFEARRGQSLGKYVLGLQVVGQDGRPAAMPRHLLRWLALHPLLFHPLSAGFFGLFTLASISFSSSDALYFFGLAATLLCFLAPLAGFAFALGDPQRRGLHDWIAGTKVVRLE